MRYPSLSWIVHHPELLACSKHRIFFFVGPREWGRPGLDQSCVLGRCAVDICCSSHPYGDCWLVGSFCDPTLVGWHHIYHASRQGRHHFWPCIHRYEIQSSSIHAAFIHVGLVALTVPIDSYFWDIWPLWPEFSSIYFNVYEGKSAEWGVSTLSLSLQHLVN